MDVRPTEMVVHIISHKDFIYLWHGNRSMHNILGTILYRLFGVAFTCIIEVQLWQLLCNENPWKILNFKLFSIFFKQFFITKVI